MAKFVVMLDDERAVWAAVFGASFALGFEEVRLDLERGAAVAEAIGGATPSEVTQEAVAAADAAVKALRIYRRDVEPSAGVCTEAIDE